MTSLKLCMTYLSHRNFFPYSGNFRRRPYKEGAPCSKCARRDFCDRKLCSKWKTMQNVIYKRKKYDQVLDKNCCKMWFTPFWCSLRSSLQLYYLVLCIIVLCNYKLSVRLFIFWKQRCCSCCWISVLGILMKSQFDLLIRDCSFKCIMVLWLYSVKLQSIWYDIIS